MGQSRPEIGFYYRDLQRKRNKKKGRHHTPNRLDNLHAIGFRSYKEYLNSPLWDRVRTSIFMLADRKCKLCGSKAQVVHHKDYSKQTLLGFRPHNLVALCEACHTKIEFHDNGKKRTQKETNKEFNRLLSLS